MDDEGPRSLEEIEDSAEDLDEAGEGSADDDMEDTGAEAMPDAAAGSDELPASTTDDETLEMDNKPAAGDMNGTKDDEVEPAAEGPGLSRLPAESGRFGTPMATPSAPYGRGSDVVRTSGPLTSAERASGDVPRSVGSSAQWRPAGRRAAVPDNPSNPLRGVTTQPGNPLR